MADYNRDKLPKIFRKKYNPKSLKRKLLSRIYIDDDREYVKGLFEQNEKTLQIPDSRTFEKDEIKRLKNMASQIKSQKGRVHIIWITALVILIAAMVTLVNIYKNPLVKRGLQYALENIFWAKADIDYVNLKIFDSSLVIKGVAVANKDKPMENLFEIGNISVDFNLVELLKKKFVMDLAQCTGITYGTPRKTSGALPEYVLKAKKEKQRKRDEAFEKKKEELLAALAAQAQDEITDILGFYDPETFLKDSLNSLQTPAMKDEIVDDMTTIYKDWQNEIESTKDQVKEFGKEVKKYTKMDISKIDTPQELNDLLMQINETKKKAEAFEKRAEDISDHFVRDTKTVQGLADKFQSSVKHDSDFIQTRIKSIKVPDIDDGKRIISSCFDTFFATLLGKWYPYVKDGIDMAKDFQQSGKTLPKLPEKQKKQKKLVVRLKGRDVTYRKDLPSFLMREIRLGGNSPDKKFSIEGAVFNICNDADLLDKPITGGIDLLRGGYTEKLDFLGDFRTSPKGNMVDVNFTGKTYPMKLQVPNAKKLKGMPTIDGKALVKANIYYDKNEKLGTSAALVLDPATITATTFKPDFIYDLYSRVLATINEVDFDIGFAYSKQDKLDFDLDTNVDRQVVRGIKKVMNEELAKLKKQLEKEVNSRLEQISTEFSQQVEKYTGMKTVVFTNVSDLKSFVADLDNQQKKLQKEIEKRVKKEVDKQVNKAKEEAQKQVDKQTQNMQKEIDKATKDMQKEMKKSFKSLF
ncbi:MAG: TIGR03545 family protein [Spirochaetia bacterium]|nr:TIGR03545 family protein [Spirochaetia bacterium]MBR3671691.1 TIGR03545 family protein [Spirochaetia bacterium]